MLNGLTAASVLYEQSGGSALQERNVAYLQHALAWGPIPRHSRNCSPVRPQPGASPRPPHPTTSGFRTTASHTSSLAC